MPSRREIGLDWDEENEAHLARHGAYPDALGEMIARGDWVRVRNKGERSRRRRRRWRLIGRDSRGMIWTLIVEPTGRPGIWRPVTGWPSAPGEVALYRRGG